MLQLTLNNGVTIPQLGLGVFQAKDGLETRNAVLWALEAGYRHIDTAAVYGNERSVGEGIKRSGVDRKDIFLTTKLWNQDIRQGRAADAFSDSLDALSTDYVDLYLIHWPAQGYEEAWDALEALYRQGRMRAIGVSNFQVHHLEQLEKRWAIVPAVNQIESHPYLSNQPLIDYCQARNIQVEVWSPLGGAGAALLADPTLVALAAKYQKTAAQIVLRWDVQRGVVALPKSVHQDRIASNLQVEDFALAEEDMARIHQLNKNLRLGADPDNFHF